MRNSRLLVGALVIALVSVSFTGVAVAATAKTSRPVAVSTSSTKPSLPRPTISAMPKQGGHEGQEGDQRGFGDDEGSAEDVARHAAMQKFQDCLSQQGVTLPQGPGFGRDQGTKPGADPMATMTDKQKAAFAACQQYAPQFGPKDGFKPAPSAKPTSKLSLKPMVPSAKPTVAPTKAMGADSARTAAYITCLNNAGVAVKTLSDINSLDRSSAKVAAALKSCAGKSPFKK